MTETVKQEFMRLVDLLPQTDPRTEAYHILLSSIERFDAIGSTINDMVDVVHSEAEKIKEIAQDNVVPFTAPAFPAETPEEQEGHEVAELVKKVVEAQPAPPSLSASDVRKLLVEARGRGVNVREVLKGFGADSFQALPAEKYDALAEALRAV